MEERNITITVEEYKKLLEMSVRVDLFVDYVNRSKYSIDREECRRFFGDKVNKEEDEDQEIGGLGKYGNASIVFGVYA